MFASNSRLLQRGVDRGELGVQVGAEAVDDSDNRERNAGRNQAVFDSGSTGLVLHETRNEFFILTPCVHLADRTNVWSRRRSQRRDHGETIRGELRGG